MFHVKIRNYPAYGNFVAVSCIIAVCTCMLYLVLVVRKEMTKHVLTGT